MARRDLSSPGLLVPPAGQLVFPHSVLADQRLSTLSESDSGRLARTDFNHGELPPDLRAVMNGGRWEWLRDLIAKCEERGEPLPWNPPTSFFNRERLSSNADLVSGDELDRLKVKLRRDAVKLLGECGYPPFALLDFYDKEECFTTKMLKQLLKDIFEDDYSRLVLDTLRANLDSDTPVKTKKNPATGKPNWLVNFENTRRNPRIWIMGGTFNDADDVHGEWFQENVMTPLLKDPNTYVIAICWAYQVMLRALAKIHELDLFVLNGAARWGAFPVEMLNTPVLQNAFSSNARRRHYPIITAGFTHSDQLVVGQQNPTLGHRVFASTPDPYSGRREEVLKIIARDGVTGLPAGYAANDSRVLGLAFHPEIRLGGTDRADVKTIKDFITSKMKVFFEQRYRVGGDTIGENFDLPNPLGRASFNNPGEAFYTSMALHFVRRLSHDLARTLHSRG